MSNRRTLRIAGWCGIVFSILSLIVIPLVASPPDPPALGTPPDVTANWYAVHRSGFLIGNFLGIAAFIPGFVQLAVLARWIRAREGAEPWLGGLVLATGTFCYAVFACSLAVFQSLPFLTAPGASHATLAMSTLASVWFALDGLAALPMILAVGWATLATKALPRWCAHVSWLTAIAALIMSFGSLVDHPKWLAGGGPATFAGFVAFFCWTTALAIVFLRIDPRSELPAR